mmetsp:Transcript_14089/g.31420  ORF Transcript_14089/g.31420 Transcript_14089/m.31420 type:complete len:218 (+) Transcript_14089:1647-2300(+)
MAARRGSVAGLVARLAGGGKGTLHGRPTVGNRRSTDRQRLDLPANLVAPNSSLHLNVVAGGSVLEANVLGPLGPLLQGTLIDDVIALLDGHLRRVPPVAPRIVLDEAVRRLVRRALDIGRTRLRRFRLGFLLAFRRQLRIALAAFGIPARISILTASYVLPFSRGILVVVVGGAARVLAAVPAVVAANGRIVATRDGVVADSIAEEAVVLVRPIARR